MLRVKIMCTIGPSSHKPEILARMIKAGMNIARLNMSHGTHEYHLETIRQVRTLSEEMKQPIAIVADLQGPKLRVGKMQAGGIHLIEGEPLILTIDDIVGQDGRVPIQYKPLPGLVSKGERILLDDGLLELEVLNSTATEIHTRIVIGGPLTDNKGMNLPDASLNIPALTDKDREDVIFALANQVDWIALSFVRTASEVLELKEIIRRDSTLGRATPVISKIEKPEAVKNIDAIIDASDAIMVARGDLGIETSPEAVPMVQKMIISKCQAAAKPVITATQMLDSMIRNPRPTRAEASDVANAVLDGSDAIMLSGETASGTYPVQSVETMAKIAKEAERVYLERQLGIQYEKPAIFTSAGAVCHAAVNTAEDIGANAIVAPTMSGSTAKLIAAFRPTAPIIAVTPSPMVQRQLCLHWGIRSLLTKRLGSTDEVLADAIRVIQESKLVKQGDTIVLTAGVVGSIRSATNLLMVRSIERVLAYGVGIGQGETAGRIVRLDKMKNSEIESITIGSSDILFVNVLDRENIRLLRSAGGLISREVGLDSFGAIAAMELGVPAVIGVNGAEEELGNGQSIVLNALTGQISEWRK